MTEVRAKIVKAMRASRGSGAGRVSHMPYPTPVAAKTHVASSGEFLVADNASG
jgi:hypothetical protein